jgi:HPt (histidine-containing phosphotransfer) domain-containing protein
MEQQKLEKKSIGPTYENKKVFVDASFSDIVPWFLNNRKEDVKKVREFLNVSDFEQIQRMGHRWKGTCASYGFEKLSEAGERFEELSAKKQNEEILHLLDQTDQYIDELEIVYVPSDEKSESNEA